MKNIISSCRSTINQVYKLYDFIWVWYNSSNNDSFNNDSSKDDSSKGSIWPMPIRPITNRPTGAIGHLKLLCNRQIFARKAWIILRLMLLCNGFPNTTVLSSKAYEVYVSVEINHIHYRNIMPPFIGRTLYTTWVIHYVKK